MSPKPMAWNGGCPSSGDEAQSDKKFKAPLVFALGCGLTASRGTSAPFSTIAVPEFVAQSLP